MKSLLLIPFFVAGLVGVLSERLLGGTLGSFLSSMVLLAVVAPGMTLSFVRVLDRFRCIWLMVLAVAACWIWRGSTMGIAPEAIAQCVLVLLALTLSVTGLAAALERLAGASAGAALAVLLGMMWLSWPIWMSPMLTGEKRERTAGVLVSGHPIFALNGVLSTHFGPWAQQPVTYRLTNIGDDIAYEMPTSAWGGILVHLIAAGMLWGSAVLRGRGAVNVPTELSGGDSTPRPRDG